MLSVLGPLSGQSDTAHGDVSDVQRVRREKPETGGNTQNRTSQEANTGLAIDTLTKVVVSLL